MKNRKRLSVILIAVMVLFSMVTQTACAADSDVPSKASAKKCDHKFEGANLIEEGTCIYCGEAGGGTLSKSTYLNKYSNTSGVKIPTEVKNLLVEFFDAFYDSQVTLESRDITKYFSVSYYTNSHVNQTALDVMVEGRKLQTNDLRLTTLSYDLKIVSVTKKSEKEYVIDTKDTSRMHFSFMRDTKSEMRNVDSTFKVIKTKNNGWKLKNASRVQNFYTDIKKEYDKLHASGYTHDQVDAALSRIHQDRIAKYKEIQAKEISRLKTANEKTCKVKSCDHKIDREACVEYAMNHIKSNRTKPDYSSSGGNCQNFASNVLLAGGIPMDYFGGYQWKHYGAYNNYNNTPAGRTGSFILVGGFYTYAKYNTGYGLAARVDINPYFGEGGDIIQVGADGNFGHTMVVVGNVKDENGKIVDLKLNANTIDVINYPMSAYGCVERRLIKIYGWND